MQKNHNILVGIQETGSELIELLASKFDQVSKKQCKRWIDMGIVCVNDRISTLASRTVSHRDTITVYLALQQERQEMQSAFAVIAEYPEFIVCNKPIGFVSCSETISDALKQSVDLVHRLDMETSGILIVAKTTAMHKALSSLFRLRKIQKEYIAVVPGGWERDSGTLTGKFRRVSDPSAKAVWTAKSTRGGIGITHFRVLKRTGNFVLLHLKPYTGRTHQLRVHCSEAGFPIIGDYHYGSTVIMPRMYLHAYGLRFKNPQTGKDIHHLSPIPREFKALWKS
ncbi:MAG: RluA family pseudouridine synthase [Chlamydiales bacterium]